MSDAIKTKKKNRKKKKTYKKSGRQKRSDMKRLLTVLGSSVLIVLLLIALVWFVSRFFHFSLFSGKNSEKGARVGVIYQINSDNVRSMNAYAGGVAVLTNSSLKYLDSSGRELESNKHNYSAPVMKVCEKNVFLFDKGGVGYRLEKNTSVFSEESAPGPILCGTVGKKGNYAFSVNNDAGYQSHILVYSAKGKKQFEWGSASDYCCNLALSDAGGRVAVAVLGAENAEYYSKVMLFSFRSGSPVFSVDFSDETVFDLDFVSSRKLAVYTDRGVYLINQNGISTPLLEYPANELRAADVNRNGLRAVVTAPFGNDQTPIVTVFSEKNKILFSRQYDGQITGVQCGDSYAGVMVDGCIELLNRDNIAAGTVDPGEACSYFAVVNHSVYTLMSDGVCRYNVFFDTQKTEAETLKASQEKSETTTGENPPATATDGDASRPWIGIATPADDGEADDMDDNSDYDPDAGPDDPDEDWDQTEDQEGGQQYG